MNKKALWRKIRDKGKQDEKGQSIVLIAFIMIGLLAFVGIAVDVGFVFARSSQLQASVDAASLAGVTELTGDANDLNRADTKAKQFLSGNEMPQAVIDSLQSDQSVTQLGETQYSITATWPLDLFFLKVVGWRTVNVSKSATAAYFPLVDIYASRRIEDGVLTTSDQGIFGPQICTSYGDPFSPLPDSFGEGPGIYTYQYRILIPADYPHDVIRVELFDPDSINNNTNDYTILHSQTAIGQGMPTSEAGTCTGRKGDQKNPCVISTDELETVGDAYFDQLNPFWFVRVDENRGSGGGNGNGSCDQPGSYTPRYNTQTVYELFYWAQNPDGTVSRIPLSTYTGQTGDGARDNGNHDTDMRWVSPGAPPSFDQPAFVPVDPGSPKTFQLSIANDMPNILTDPATGSRYLYLNVSTISGASENGFEIWAGPPDYISTVPSEVNARNLKVVNEPGSHTSRGVTVFGMGNLPMNSNTDNRVDIPLIYVPPEYTGQTISVSLFDTDSGAQPPVVFFFDSLAFKHDDSVDWKYDKDETDWAMAFAVPGEATDPDGVPQSDRCIPGGCNNQWVSPPYRLTVPGYTEECDPGNPDQDVCTPFSGGRLTASYDGGENDTYGWQIRLEGLPYLVK